MGNSGIQYEKSVKKERGIPQKAKNGIPPKA